VLRKLLTGHRKELGRALTAVRIDRQVSSVALLFLQVIPRARKDRPPDVAIHPPVHWRKAVGVTVEHVELVRHFVDDHVVPRFLRDIEHIRLRQDHRPAPPNIAGQRRVGLVNYSCGIHLLATWNEGVRVHDDAVPTVVPIKPQLQDRYASVSREQNAVEFIKLQPRDRHQRLAVQE
jgi:hypothetical protein